MAGLYVVRVIAAEAGQLGAPEQGVGFHGFSVIQRAAASAAHR